MINLALPDILGQWYILYAPTILFALIVIFAMIGGFIKGFRKSLIKLIHMCIAGSIVIVTFVIFFKLANYQDIFYNLVDTIVKMTNNTIPGLLNITTNANTFEDIFNAYLSGLPSDKQIFGTVASDLMPYVNVFIELAIRIVVALLLLVVYFIIRLILGSFYFMFYSERKYKRKRNQLYDARIAITPYSRHRFGGLLIGGFRGVVKGIVYFSFLGSLIWIITGGSEDTYDTTNINFGEGNYQTVVDVYGLIRNYGSTGILGTLNSVKDAENRPYYFIIADSIFQGTLVDESQDLNEAILIREELTGYTSLMTAVLDLIATTDVDMSSISTNTQEENIELFQNLLDNEEFSVELNEIFETYKSPKFTTSLCIHLIDSIVTNYDEYEAEITAAVPDAKLSGLIGVVFGGENAIKPTDLVTEEDARKVLDMSMEMLAYLPEFTNNPPMKDMVASGINILDRVMSTITTMSVFTNEEKRTDVNALMSDIVEYSANNYVEKFDLTNLDLGNMDIDWVGELEGFGNLLISFGDIVDQLDFNNMQSSAINLFKSTNTNYEANKTTFDNIAKLVSDSELLSAVMGANGVYSLIEKSLSGALGGIEITIPHDIVWGNVYDTNNQLVTKGEISIILDFMFEIAGSGLDAVADNSLSTQAKMTSIMNALNTPNTEGFSVIDRISESTLIYYTCSAVLLNFNISEFELYIPDSVKVDYVSNSITYEMVSEIEIQNTLKGLATVLDNLGTIDMGNQSELVGLIENTEVYNAFTSSKILEATISVLVSDMLVELEDQVYIPINLRMSADNRSNIVNWMSTEDTPGVIENGELRNIIDSVLSLGILDMVTGSSTNDMFSQDLLLDLTEEQYNEMTKSEVLYGTICKTLNGFDFSDMTIIIPSSVYDLTYTEEIDIIERIELWNMINGVKVLFTTDPITNERILDVTNMIGNISTLIASEILHATSISYLMEGMGGSDVVIVTEDLALAATVSALSGDFSTNLWNTTDELSNLIEGLNVFGLDLKRIQAGTLSMDDIDVLGLDEAGINTIYESSILAYTISANVDSFGGTDGTIVIPDEIYDSLKETTSSTGTTIQYVYSSEIINLITAFSELGITKLNAELTPDNVTTYDRFNRPENEQSGILLATISDIIITNFSVPTSSQNTIDYTSCNVIKAVEIYKMLTDFNKLNLKFNSNSGAPTLALIYGAFTKDAVLNEMAETTWLLIARDENIQVVHDSWAGGYNAANYEPLPVSVIGGTTEPQVITRASLADYIDYLINL